MKPGYRETLLSVLLGLFLPLAVSVAWIPMRTSTPNVDLALILLVLVCGLGVVGRRAGVVVGAMSAALWFEFFDTAPFERLGIARLGDLATTLGLVVVALIMGELAIRLRRHRIFAKAGTESLSTVRSAAALVASGEELVLIIEAVVADLTHLLGLAGCSFESGEPEAEPAETRCQVDRSGRLLVPSGWGEHGATRRLVAELLVVAQGVEIGRFVLDFGRTTDLPDPERMLVGVTLADTVGAAFLAQAPPPIPPDRHPQLPLRLLTGSRAGGTASASSATGPGATGQETSGVPSAAASMSL